MASFSSSASRSARPASPSIWRGGGALPRRDGRRFFATMRMALSQWTSSRSRGATSVPDRPIWLHEVKYDGYRLRLEREGNRVRLITRGGYNWADRYPWIVEAALRNRCKQFVIDGEAVLLGADGISDFDGLQSRRHDDKVWLYAFDILTLDGEDLRGLPLSIRKQHPARLLKLRPNGI